MSESTESQKPLGFDLRTRIAAVQAQHHHWDHAGALTCACGETFGLGVEAGWEAAVAGWAVHVADAVIRELNLSTDCQSGCMWQIPDHVEDMTEQQWEHLERTAE